MNTSKRYAFPQNFEGYYLSDRNVVQELSLLEQAYRHLCVSLLESIYIGTDGVCHVRDHARLGNALQLAEEWQLMQ